MTTQDSNNEGPGDPTVMPFRDVNAETMQRRIADDLRQARVERGMELREAADVLRIRAVYLEALEDGRFGDLPGPTYVAGFLRTYGDALGLDGEELVRRYKDDTGGVLARQQLNFPVPASEARQPTVAIIAITVILGLLIFGGWYVYKERMLVDLERVPEVPDTIETGTVTTSEPALAEADDVPEGAMTSGADEPEAAAMTETVEPEAAEEETASANAEADSMDTVATAEITAAADEALIEPLEEATEAASADNSSEVLDAEPEATLAETEALLNESNGYVPRIYGRTNTDSRVEIRATEESWIQVEAPNNEILLTRVLLPGDIYRVPNRSDVTLDTGNAGGLEVKVDGEVIGPLGEPGIVVRNVSLSADELLSR
jgi:cytoskeleton protein RodZ